MRNQTKRSQGQAGFSLIELMISIVILMIIMGAIFSQIDFVQKRYRSEEVKLDMFQTAREFVDQMTRDIHQAGFPNGKLYSDMDPSPNTDNTYDGYALNERNAVGIYFISPTEIRFQGDVNGDGVVDAVAYRLFSRSTTPGDENCPCLRRSQLMKAGGTMPMDQEPDWRTQVENLTFCLPNMGCNPDDVSKAVVFIPYAKDGSIVDVASAPLTKFQFHPQDDGDQNHFKYGKSDPINTIWSVRILVTVQGQVADIGTGYKPQAFLTTTAQVNN